MSDAHGAQVRYPVWRGRQAVAGLWLPADWLDARQRGERLLHWWAPGCRAWRFDRGPARGDLLRFEAERALHCDDAGGTPLCRIGAHGLYAGPLTAAEREGLAPADVRLVLGGQSLALDLADGEALDPSLAIELDDYALHDTFVCDRALPKLQPDKIAGKAVRELLGDRIAPPSEERQRFLRALGRNRDDGDGAGKPGWLERATGARDGAAAWLLRRFPGLGVGFGGGGGDGGADGFGSSAGAAGATPSGSAGGIAQRRNTVLPQRWRAALARMAAASGAARLIGLRQGAYLRRLLEQFDHGDTLEALRHALPIDGDDAGSLGQSFGTPGRRDDLSLSAQRSAGASIGAGHDIRELLRQRYRRAFERLDAAGKIDEAVFVLAELLNARQEALDYLVKHGRAAQAAELALGWDMPADAIIRLLMLAGDAERATLVARRDNAFATALALLEGAAGHRAHALSLRREWGRALAAQGRWLDAVEAVWPDPQSREQAARWLQTAEAGGAELSARALVRRAALLPDTLQHYAGRVAELTDPDAPAAPREALGVALATIAHAQRNQALARIAARALPALAADRAGGANALERAQLDRIRALAADPWLDADLPAWGVPPTPPALPLWERRAALEANLQADPGLQAPLDLAALGDGRWLAAFGEAGAAMFDAAGRCLKRYAAPAHRLVIGDSGEVALALARRESVWRIARLDLTAHRIEDLGALPLQFFADRFDGVAWAAVAGQRIVAFDAGPAGEGGRPLQVLWSVGDLGGDIVQARFLRHDELFLVAGRGATTVWHYRTHPSRALVSRDPVEVPAHGWMLLDPHNSVDDVVIAANEDGGMRFSFRFSGRNCAIDLEPPEPGSGECESSLIPLARGFLVVLHGAYRMRAYLIRRGNDEAARCVARIDWPQARLRAREQADRLVLFDDEGRAMSIALETSQVRSVQLR
ncbi:bpX6 domain-containing protein [Lysobacter enzymogenes]|uniref:MoxR-vWA-beta-propeller ternary system domain-containing protein n=1 Tax=Lysobacter enzymogenes TaxID=69 RepID=A0A3N2RHK5_LYSEN|nr:bpX6 domain-containing protein [Lysobacter enzymogenes]ROU06982.1 hypothetical protein D9T17_10690 [Lysobacter enzymogenes]